MHPTVSIAIRAAQSGAEQLTTLQTLLQDNRQDQAFVASLPGRLQKVSISMQRTLAASFPEQRVSDNLDTEFYNQPENSDIHWHIELLHGQQDFIRALPDYGLSLAQYRGERMEHLVIAFPALDQVYTCSRGQGAQLNDKKIRVSGLEQLKDGMIAGSELSLLSEYQDKASNVRLSCNPWLNIARVASGAADLVLEKGLKNEALQSAMLLAQETGAITADFSGAPVQRKNGQLVMTTSRLLRQFIKRA